MNIWNKECQKKVRKNVRQVCDILGANSDVCLGQ